jgi:septum formation protein
MTDLEILNYVDSKEPLNVAGGFTLDGLSAPFIKRIEGDPSGIIGLSLPILREMLMSLGYDWPSIKNIK